MTVPIYDTATLRSLTINPNSLDTLSVHDNTQWLAFQRVLSNGSTEQRKLLLYILNSTIQRLSSSIELEAFYFEINRKDVYTRQYSRYIALYETVVLARYANQVQDALHELTLLSSPESKVKSSWIVCLLYAGLADGMQDSVRKLIGKRVLQNGLSVLISCIHQGRIALVSDFIENAFLPWATIGSHVTSSVRKARSNTECPFGETLSRFFEDLLTSSMKLGERTALFTCIFKFIADRGERIFPFSRAFVLQGVVNAADAVSFSPNAEQCNLLNSIWPSKNFQELVADLMLLQCAKIVSRISSEACSDLGLDPLMRAASSILDSHSETALRQVQTNDRCFVELSLEQAKLLGSVADDATESLKRELAEASVSNIKKCLDLSHSRVLWGAGLASGSTAVLRALELDQVNQIDPEELESCLCSLWEQIEIQDYPRRVLMKAPEIFLHEKTVRLSITSPSLANRLSTIVDQMQKLSEGRIYVFAALYESMRTVAFSAPESLDVLPWGDWIFRYSKSPPSPKVEFALEELMAVKLESLAPIRTYSYYYGKHAEFGHTCVYDLVNSVPSTSAASKHLLDFIERILYMWGAQKSSVPVHSPWKTSSQLQLLLISLERIVATVPIDDLERYLKTLLRILGLEPLPRYRFLLEWIIARLLRFKSHWRTRVPETLNVMDVTNPKFVVSTIKLSLLLATLDDSQESFTLEVMTQLVVLSASPKVVIRHEAHWTVPQLWDHAQERNWESIINNPAFARLNASIRTSESFRNPPPGRVLEKFHAERYHDLGYLFEGKYLLLQPHDSQSISRESFIQLWEEVNDVQSNRSLPIGEDRRSSLLNGDETDQATTDERQNSHDEQARVIPIQTKSSTWENLGLESMQNGTEDKAKSKRISRDVIVIASLIDNAFNLGGICRVTELFGAAKLMVRNRNVVTSKDFIAVSVSSHLWLPLEELPVQDISAFVRTHQENGYKAIGLEQTDSSVVLGEGDWRFPSKTLLIIGSEREGIPGNVLAITDACVEIKQMGMTRSMNVQTSCAVALYEYSRHQGEAQTGDLGRQMYIQGDL